METRANQLQTEDNKRAYDERNAHRAQLISNLSALLEDDNADKAAITSKLKELGFGMEEGFERKTVEEMRGSLAEVISSLKEDSSGALNITSSVSEVGKPAETVEAENVASELTAYHQEYSGLSDEIKARADWTAITERLLANNSEKLKLAQAMQGGGQLIGIDVEGKALFKSRGVEPVMYGFDEDDKLLKIYDRDPKQMKQVKKWANYHEIREQVLDGGYEMFADDGDYGFSDEIKQVTDHTEEPFVASKDKEEWRASWLESGDKPDAARDVRFFPVVGRVHVSGLNPGSRNAGYGVVRLLRV